MVHSAVEEIETMIAAGRLAPGQRLIEADLEKSLGLGRMPIREALRILAGDGVVELTPNRGAKVREYTRRHLAEMLKTLSALLCANIEEFVRSPDFPSAMQRLEAIATDMAKKRDALDGNGQIALVAEYQQTIFETTGNSYLLEVHRRARFHQYNRAIMDAVGLGRLCRMTKVYDEINRALRNRKAERASDLFKKSLEESVRVLEQDPAS